jgi:hypothetical protein
MFANFTVGIKPIPSNPFQSDFFILSRVERNKKMIRLPSRTITCMMLSASLAIWTLAGETSFSQTQAEGAPESPPIIQEDTSPSEGQGDVIERGTTRDHRGQQKLLPPPQRTLPAPETTSPIIRDHRTPSTSVPSQSAPATGTSGPSSVVGGTLSPTTNIPGWCE